MSSGAQLINPQVQVPLPCGAERDRHVFVVCNGEQCRHKGSGGLLDLLRAHRCSHQNADRDVRIGSSRQCIGRCTMAPTMIEDGRVMGWMSLRRLRVELIRLGLLSPAS
jgi:NADH:ubiquinone oxidoreductase subunit E